MKMITHNFSNITKLFKANISFILTKTLICFVIFISSTHSIAKSEQLNLRTDGDGSHIIHADDVTINFHGDADNDDDNADNDDDKCDQRVQDYKESWKNVDEAIRSFYSRQSPMEQLKKIFEYSMSGTGTTDFALRFLRNTGQVGFVMEYLDKAKADKEKICSGKIEIPLNGNHPPEPSSILFKQGNSGWKFDNSL